MDKKKMKKLFITEATHIKHIKKSHPNWFKKQQPNLAITRGDCPEVVTTHALEERYRKFLLKLSKLGSMCDCMGTYEVGQTHNADCPKRLIQEALSWKA